MDKLTMAQDYIIAEVRRVGVCSIDEDKIVDAWKIADAMQAEADKRINKERPEVLEEWQPDWSQAPETAIAWKMQSKSNAVWIHNKSLSAFEYSIAPSFNYQGNWQDSLRKRPEALCEVDWSVAPDDAIGWVIFDGASTWLGGSGYLIEEAPSFGFTGSHIMERPNGF